MNATNPIVSFILSIFFLKEYYLDEEKLRIIKKRFSYFLGIWILFILAFLFGLHGNHSFVKDIPENIYLQLTFIFFLLFAIYHWFFLIYISKFAKRHIAYLVLFLPMIYFFSQNLILWNKPTYYGAMDGFASISTIIEQITIIVILPTFLFALRMIKIENKFKGILLFLITTVSAILGIKQCIGKEGYLSDSTGQTFAVLVIILLAVAIFLIKFSNKNNLIKK